MPQAVPADVLARCTRLARSLAQLGVHGDSLAARVSAPSVEDVTDVVVAVVKVMDPRAVAQLGSGDFVEWLITLCNARGFVMSAKLTPSSLATSRNRLTVLEFLVTEAKTEILARGVSPSMLTDAATASPVTSAVRLARLAAATGVIATAWSAETISAVASGIKQAPGAATVPILQSGCLSEAQVSRLVKLNEALAAEYSVRRLMVLKRVDVTLASAVWAQRDPACQWRILRQVQLHKRVMVAAPDVSVAHVWTLTPVDLCVSRISSAASASHGRIGGVVIGPVPDRGGRVSDTAKGVMPAWKPRVASSSKPRGRGRGRGRKR